MPKLELTSVRASASSTWVYMPSLEEVFAHADDIPPFLLRPLLRLVDGGEISTALRGLPLAVVAHEVGLDELEFHVEADGRYRLARYGDLEIPADVIRTTLEGYIDDEYDGAEELEDENAELFDEDEPRQLLRVDSDEGDDDDDDDDDDDVVEVEVEIGRSTWLQHVDGGQPGEDSDGFALALVSHPILFGRYYLFVDAKRRRIRQVFQCT